MKIKKGDIVKDMSGDGAPHIYGLVDHVGCNGYEVWAMWANTLEDLKNKKYSSNMMMWCSNEHLEVVEEIKKEIKIFGIAEFCKNNYK